MAVSKSMDLVELVREHLAKASPDVLRELVEAFANALMSAEADAICGAPYGEVSPERVDRRNGYRERPWDTRAGSIGLRIPKLRAGSYFPDWLLERVAKPSAATSKLVFGQGLRYVHKSPPYRAHVTSGVGRPAPTTSGTFLAIEGPGEVVPGG